MNIQENIKTFQQNAGSAAAFLKALANDKRLMILCQLVENELCVGDLIKNSGLSQSAFSQHLSVLRKDGLVKTRKESQTVYYSLANKDVLSILEVLHKIYCR
jgi:ArsR family transcriptional regulator, virulence genes transcriptional regulator